MRVGTATKQYSQAFRARLYEMVGLVYEMRQHTSLSTQQCDRLIPHVGNVDNVRTTIVGVEDAELAA